MSHLSFLLAPGKKTMRKLKVSGKFGLVALTFLIPLLLALVLALARFNEELEFSHQEMQGAQYLKQWVPVLLQAQDLSALMTSQLAGDEVSAALINENLNKIQNGVQQFHQHIKNEKDIFGLAKNLQAVEQAITELQKNKPGAALAAQILEHKIVENIVSSIEQIYDNSNLVLDPEFDAYYLITSTQSALEWTNSLAKLRRLLYLQDASSLGSMTAGKLELEKLSTAADVYVNEVVNRQKKFASSNPVLKKKVDVEKEIALTKNYLDKLRKQAIDEHELIDLTLLSKLAGTAMSAVYAQQQNSLNVVKELIQKRVDKLENRRNFLLSVVGFFGLVAVYFFICLFTTTREGFNTLDQRLSQLAQGDFTHLQTLEGRDEISRAVNLLTQSMQSIAKIIQGVRGSADAMNTAGAEIAVGNNELSERGEEQAAIVEQTSACMAQISEGVQRNLEHAQKADELSNNALHVAQRGGELVNQAIDRMDLLTASSRKIGDITSVIDGIAFQTNILALNAAVEAARAGEQGRGFAVVASEVRNLAQRSALAAKEIKELIEASSQNVDSSAALVKTTGETMQEIVNSVAGVAGIMKQIYSASTEQNNEISQLKLGIAEIDTATQRTAALSEQASSTATDLQEQAVRLVNEVAFFKLNENGQSV